MFHCLFDSISTEIALHKGASDCFRDMKEAKIHLVRNVSSILQLHIYLFDFIT